MIFAGADDMKGKLTNIISNIYGAIKVDFIKKNVKNNAYKALHIDNRDVDSGEKLL